MSAGLTSRGKRVDAGRTRAWTFRDGTEPSRGIIVVTRAGSAAQLPTGCVIDLFSKRFGNTIGVNGFNDLSFSNICF